MRLARALVVVAAATMFANAAAYGMSLVAARQLPPAEFGSFGALLSLSIIASTIAIACQTVAARRVAAHPDASRREETHAHALGLASAAALLGVSVALTPAVCAVLDVSAVAASSVLASVAVAVVGFTALGVLQGHQSHLRFGAAYAALGALRAAGTVAAAAVHPTVDAAAIGMLLGSTVGTVAAVAWGRRLPRRGRVPRDAFRELARNVGSMLGLYVFINLDVLLARAYLTPAASGTYAVGSLVAKIAFFLPTSVITVLFPRIAAEAAHGYRRLALGATAAVGAVFTAACALGPGLVLELAGGDTYAAIGPHLWLFALQGSAFAVAQAAVLARLASREARAALPVWAATVAFAAAVVLGWHASVLQIVTTSLVVTAALVVLVLAADGRSRRAAEANTPALTEGRTLHG